MVRVQIGQPVRCLARGDSLRLYGRALAIPAVRFSYTRVCEVLSPSTSTLDRTRKLPVYAREGVEYAWLLEPLQRTLEVFKLQGRQWVTVGTWDGDAKVRAEPFDAIELALADLWADIGPREV